MKRLSYMTLVAFGLCGLSAAQTTTIYTGTIKDLSGSVVTAGQVQFNLAPSVDSTISGTSRFTPMTFICNINSDGTISAQAGGACTVIKNTALSPKGTSYRICVQPYNATPGSCFYDYATTASKDISTVAPTLSTGPINYGGVRGQVLVASLTTTATTLNVVILIGMASTGHCSQPAPTNSSAAANIATTYISAKATNQITLTHVATAGMTFDISCVPY